MVCSVTEGEDKPLKYPLMFRACELVRRQQDRPAPAPRLRPRQASSHNLDAVNPGVERDAGAARARARASRRGATGCPRCRRAQGGRRGVTRGGQQAPARIDLLRGAHRGQRAPSSRPRPSASRGCCHRMAERFARGGRLVALGRSPAARSDVRHVAVEFVHPVIVGKRALPAIGLSPRGRAADRAGRRWSPSPTTSRSPSAPTSRTAETVAALALRARARLPDDRLRARRAPSGSSSRPSRGPVRAPGAGRDALPRALGAGARVLRPPRPARGPRGARRSTTPARRASSTRSWPSASTTSRRSSRTCARSVLMKAEEVGDAARADARPRAREALLAAAAGAARALRRRAASCWRSATAARRPTRWTWSPTSAPPPAAAGPPRPAIDLTEDPAILTAIANDIGVEAIFRAR